MKPLDDLIRRWTEEADLLERYRDMRGAEVCRLHAGELREALRSHDGEILTLTAASEVSGYSTDHLRHLVADGTIPNAGRKGSPRVRRADLPAKARRGGGGSAFDARDAARGILNRTRKTA